MAWLWVVLVVWAVLACVVALVIGRGIHLADQRRAGGPGRLSQISLDRALTDVDQPSENPRSTPSQP